MQNNPLSMLTAATSGNLTGLIQNVLMGKLQNHPLMSQYNQMFKGKSQEEQLQTLINSAKSFGIDVNEKCFTKEQLKTIGINI